MRKSKLSIFVKSYWNYFLELEEQLLNTQKYLAFDVYNKKAYSIEYLKLMQAVCSEIDVVAKSIASDFEQGFKVDKANISNWGYALQQHLPGILTTEAVFHKELHIQPWKNWMYEEHYNKRGAKRYRLTDGSKTPSWWVDYNSIKHARTSIDENGEVNYVKANQENIILCFAALFILEAEYIFLLLRGNEPECEIEESKLFELYYPFINKQGQVTK